ncbi:MAG: hypothetical protein HQK89_14630, partial [Nitrospirae bacterium]|nr:hypothetical protein [Nitrospirota bacterium]
IQQWYSATQAGCTAGTGTCSITPAIALTNGPGTWWVQTYNDAGYGPWSNGMGFTMVVAAPGAATLVSPTGTITNATPPYTWNAVSGSTWYQLWVENPTGTPLIRNWYSAVQAGCTAGTGTCSVTPTTALTNGTGAWWIQTWNATGNGAWSSGMSFIKQ